MPTFCPQCGRPADPGADDPKPRTEPDTEPDPEPMSELGSAAPHARCADAARWEPPRYCRHCGRRMVVQVTPFGWRASCSRHGDLFPAGPDGR